MRWDRSEYDFLANLMKINEFREFWKMYFLTDNGATEEHLLKEEIANRATFCSSGKHF